MCPWRLTLLPLPLLQVLEGLLSSLHDELQALLAPGQGLRSEAVAGEVVLAVWSAALGCVQALAQHQAGFRPLNEAVRNWDLELFGSVCQCWGPRRHFASATCLGGRTGVPLRSVQLRISEPSADSVSRCAHHICYYPVEQRGFMRVPCP